MATILVVEDDANSRDMLTRRLQRKGFTTREAEHGAAALALVAAEPVDLVLLDVMMPGMDGLEVLRRLREKHTIEHLPVIMVTAKDQSEDIVHALEIGANDYVAKPIDIPVLLARLRTHLNLKRLAGLKDEFLRIASHDLKNPLMVIAVSSGLLQRQVAGGALDVSKARELLERLAGAGRTMQRIIEDFLDCQAMEDGHMTLKREAVNLNRLVDVAVQGVREYAQGKQVELGLALDPNVPDVSADPARIAQILQNLIGNAIKFGPPGCRVMIRSLVDGRFVRVEVSDTGPGLTPDDLKKVFTRYARLGNKPTGGEKSSGLGLAICKQLMDLHGGELGVRNNPERGATFWFSLPLDAGDPKGIATP